MMVEVPIEEAISAETFTLNINLSATVSVSADTARRKASQFVMRHVSHLMGGSEPQLVWRNDLLFWSVPIQLTYPSLGDVGTVGSLAVDAVSGIVAADEAVAEELKSRAAAIASRLPLETTPAG